MSIAHGQAITGRIVGTIQDADQGAVPNAKVTIVNQNTGISWDFQTDAQGNYLAPSLPPGTYKVTAAASGFRQAVTINIVVNVAQTTRMDFSMEIGNVQDTVEVTAAAPLVESAASGLGEVIDRRQIQALPLNGRLFSQLVHLTPGAIPEGPGDATEATAGSGARSSIMARVNGVYYATSNYTIDGVSNKEQMNAFINISPPLEAIEEFKVQTNNPSAEFGGFGGATVNLTIRSGTNELHGSLFEYFRNDVLNARKWETRLPATKTPLRSNQFGGTIGGPIIKNKAFFFFSYQSLRLRLGQTRSFAVPTALMRQGIFAASEGFPTIYDPTNGNRPFEQITIDGRPASRIPQNQWDPVSAKLLDIWPLPNVKPTAFNVGPNINYVENISQKNDPDQYDIKVNFKLSGKSDLFVRESYNPRTLRNPAPGNRFISSDPNADSSNHNAVIGHTYTFTPTLLSELRIGFNRFNTFHFANDFGVNKSNELGIKNGNLPGFPETSGIANFGITGIVGFGGPGFTDAQRLTNTIEVTEGLTWTKNSHALKIGADIMRTFASLTNPQTAPRGIFDFDANYTSIPDPANVTRRVGGAAFASFLLGFPNRIRRDIVDTKPYVGRWLMGFYVQDDFRATQKLTLNLGVRFDVFSTFRERYNRQTNLNLKTGLFESGSDDNPAPNVNGFTGVSPRLGFAYSPDRGKTAFRGAFGISYANSNFGANVGTLERNFPLFQLFDRMTPNQFVPFAKVSVDGLPGYISQPLAPTIPVPASVAPFFMPKDLQPDNIYMWNLAIQRQITNTSVVETAYVGTRGVHLFRGKNINTPLVGLGPQPARRPFNSILPQVGNITQRGSDGDSHYHSLQVKYTKRFSAGLQGLVSYTWSKSTGDVVGGQGVFWPYDDRLNKGLLDTDVPHNLVASFTYELPFGRGKRWIGKAPRFLDMLAGGWTLSDITMIRSGSPLTVTVTNSLLNTGTGNRADRTCNEVKVIGTPEQWFDTGCYSLPAQLVFGNSGRGSTRGPGFVNFDLSLAKAEKIAEKYKIEFRAEF
ncbi:MAG TPA: TonB-dependent receptor, partial [Pyrinomonadaceae bacterium]|nr:TonB-dependent receptor [Pyrinomonadaceae bacterium]